MFPKKLVTRGQTVGDIARLMDEVAAADAPYYSTVVDRLKLPADTRRAAASVFAFLKNHCVYEIEPETQQRVMRLPALLHYCGRGIDCKNYSLFAAGAMAAHAAKFGTGATVLFRFAGYGDNGLEHVFAVVQMPDGSEIWLDPVLAKFDQRSPTPYIWQDKPLKMALYKIGSVNGGAAAVGFDPVTATLITQTISQQGQQGQQGQQSGEQQSQMLQQFGNLLPELLRKNGVSPGFFQRFQFLRVLDNSTGKWKSRAAFLADKTPNERIAFYIEAMQKNEPCDQTVIQYPELYGHKRKTDKGTPSDVGLVDRELVTVYNSLVQSNYLKGAASVKCGKWDYPAEYLLLPGGMATNGRSPLQVTRDFLGLSDANAGAGAGAGLPGSPRPMTAGMSGTNLLLIGAAAAVLYKLWQNS